MLDSNIKYAKKSNLIKIHLGVIAHRSLSGLECRA